MTRARRRPTRRRAPPTRGPQRSRTAARRRGPPARDTRADLFHHAAEMFSARGFDAVGVDEIARAAGVNKAMLYYHFRDKLDLYREVVRDMLRDFGSRVGALADTTDSPDVKVRHFVATFIALTEARPWGPPLMLREMADGAPHLDLETLKLMRDVFARFSRILAEGQASSVFHPVHPILAYMSIIAPLLLNAARERAARPPGRADLPMFVTVSHDELSQHMQRAAVRLLAKD
ncbi:MAG: TetR/AcrR family transcriptional regulator [Vicinamibacterales bacterium]